MAEALVVAGIVSNIAQLVDFSSKILRRLDEFQSRAGEIPNTFRHITAELTVLQHALEQTKDAIEGKSIREKAGRALLPALEGCQEQITLLNDILAKTLPTPDDSWSKRSRKALVSVQQDAKVENIMKILRSYISALTFYYAAAPSTLRPLTDENFAKIRQWLSAPDPSPNYQKALTQRQANTGIWFLESEGYAKWKTDVRSFLWLYGIPGCGKTVLNSTILQNVLQYCAEDTGKVVAYFYFDFNDLQKRIPNLMVRSLISQLAQQCLNIPTTLETLFSSSVNRQQQPSLDELLDVLQQMIQEFPQAYIILDALDECSDRAELLDALKSIVGWRLKKLHILVTSRKERDIENSLEHLVDQKNTICLQSELVDKDIHTYVRQRLSQDRNLRKWHKDPEIRQEIEAAITGGAHGMFRWAACQLDRLVKCVNRFKLRHSLATLPPTLDETYDRILCAIDDEYFEYAVRILRWLAFSARPLQVEEISEVVAIDPDRDLAFDRQEVLEDPEDVLNICSSLVTITTTEIHRKVVLLAHYSVKEYLISERCYLGKAPRFSLQHASSNEFMARSCLHYILQFQSSGSSTNGTIEKSKLARYSAKFWPAHVQLASPKRERLNKLIIELFSTENGAYHNWIRIHNPDGNWFPVTKKLESIATPLYYASLLGLTEIVSLLILQSGVNVNARSGSYGTALQAASVRGHDQIVERLLKAGADVNAQVSDGLYGTALQAASAEGHDLIVERLLKAGADVNAQVSDGLYGTALQAASARGHDQIVERLLKAGADVNAQGGGGYGTALQAASARGHDQIVERLLKAGADVNAQGGGGYGTALQAASAGGHDQIVERLLKAGADVNAQVSDGLYGTALQAASAGGHDQIVERLLKAGADVNAQGGGGYGTALQAASARGHDQIVERLLKAGADVNAQGGGHCGTALQAASAGGHDQIVERLLKAGADVNAQVSDGLYGTALQAASARGHDQIVERLLKAGADVNAQGGGHCGTALQAASAEGHDQIVERLLKAGADVSAQGGRYGTALQAASAGGHDQIVERLLKAGADVNAQGGGGYYGTALQAASARWHDQIVERLLKAGADVNAQGGGGYGTALQAASARGHDQIVERLLKAGADVNAQGGGGYGTALQAASAGGHDQIVERLLKAGADLDTPQVAS